MTRILEPHGIVLKGGKWYVVAVCDGALRTYRISQVLSLTALEEGFERLAGFSLPTYWAAHIAAFREGLQQGEATIRLSPDGRERARDLLSQAVTAAVDATAVPDEGGWVTAVVPIESLTHAQSSLPRAGGRGRGAGAGEPAGADGGRGGGHGPAVRGLRASRPS